VKKLKKYDPIPIKEIKAAQKRIAGTIIRTPLVKLNIDDTPAEIYLKLENLQPIGSFKIRGASNAMKIATPDELKNGVWTTSAGNHGQGVAWNARKLAID
jgi:threonine dehydratase